MLLVATLGAYGLPPIYDASSTVVVEPVKAPSIRAEAYGANVETIEILNTEMAIVLSRTVMQNAVDKLKLLERRRAPSVLGRAVAAVRWGFVTLGLLHAVDRREQLIAGLLLDVKVRPTVNSHIFTIRYAHEDPRLAADIVNAITDEYLNHHFGIYSEKGVAEFYRVQVDQAQEKLNAAREELERYKAERGLAAALPRKEKLVEELRNVRERVSRFNLDLGELVARLGRDDQRVAVLREKIRASEDEVTRLGQQIQDLESAEARVSEMELSVKAQEKSYLAYRDQLDRASVSAAGNKSVVNVRVVDYANIPARPSVSRLFMIVVAAGAGLVLALTVAMVREYFDHRVVTRALAEELLGVPVLGSIEQVP